MVPSVRTSSRTESLPDVRRTLRPLRAWFRTHRRPLPWRADRDPYRIWVAEVLLQQTRVEQAAPYYIRFLRRFPDIGTLARARPSSVLREWAGAGYYARARHLHAAARILVKEYGGVLPREPDRLFELPGIGPYVANAIASLAFDRPVLALEANGLRVAARLTADTGQLSSAVVRGRLARWLGAALPRQRSGEFNEALMELGEVVCRPARPRCSECPLASHCRARHEYPDPGVLPLRSARPQRPLVRACVAVIEQGERVLLQRRPSTGLLGGLWELPGGKREGQELPEETCRRELREELGVQAARLRHLGVIRHSYTHFQVELDVFESDWPNGRSLLAEGGRRRWVRPGDFLRYPMPRATERALELAGFTVRPRSSPDSVFRPGRRET